MSHHSRARIAWVLGALTLALAGGTVLLAVLGRTYRGDDLDSLPFFVACALVGSLIAARQPGNTIGWIMLGGALSFSLMSFTGYYALYGVAVEPGSLPAAYALAWPQTWLWVVGGALLYLLLPFSFPDGRPLSPRWRWFPPAVITAAMAMAAVAALTPGEELIQVQTEPPSIVNPLGIDEAKLTDPTTLARFLDAAVPGVIIGMLGVAVGSLLIRFHRSRGIERQQMKWLAYTVAAFPVLNVLDTLIGLPSPVVGVYLVCIPVAVGIAVLRHNLYDIDLIINRTLVYGALTGAVAGIYIFAVGYLGALLQASVDVTDRSGWQTPISLVATGVVAVLFQPMREQLQRGVNRLMYGERAEPYTVLSRLGQRLEGSLAPDAVLATIVETVREALRLPYAAIMLRESDQLVLGAACGTLSGSPVRLPLIYQEEPVGELVLAPRAPGETFGPADQRLLLDLVRHIGTTAHNVRLAHQLLRANADLQRSREQLVLSREEERRRLRRELHDGLAPTLAALNLKAGMIRDLLRVDSDAAEVVLDEWRAEIRATIAGVRQLAYELRPPILDELGLAAAIQERADRDRTGQCRVTVHGPDALGSLPAAVEVAAFRIVQEALTNVDRHAEAETCQVRLWCCDTPRASLCIEVVDDGVGFPDPSVRSGVGMLSMQERAAELGGTCTLEPNAEGGVRLHARLPLGPE